MIKTLQKKFILSAMLAITILLVLLLGAINIGNVYTSKRQNGRMLEELLNEELRMQPPGDDKPKGFFDGPMTEDSKMSAVYFTVRTDREKDGIKADTGRIASISEEEAVELCRSVMETGSVKGKIQNFRYRMAVNEQDGSMVYLFLDTSVQLHSIVTVLLFSLLAGAVCWLAMLLLVVVISKRAIRPIAENLARQKQFVTNAGHEIKTPLAIILANTEAMELYQGENKWSRNIREQTLRLNGLMQDLLMLARADESRDALPTETVSVSSVVLESIQMFAEPMEQKELQVCRKIGTGIGIRANKEQIRRLFSLLVDNAVKYSQRGGVIAVSLEQRGRAVVFQIGNTCEQLPECPPEKLFDRFYRADAARTQQGGGYGIGLSAARTITELYGGNIKASYEPPDRILFTVIFS